MDQSAITTDVDAVSATESAAIPEVKGEKPRSLYFHPNSSISVTEVGQESKVIPEDLFSKSPTTAKSPITNAISAFREYQTLLATKVQQITRWARQKSVEEAKAATAVEFSFPSERQGTFNKRTTKSVCLLALRAKLEDEMKLVIEDDRIYFTKSKDAKSPSLGPAHIEFVGPLKEVLADDPWIITELPLVVEHNPAYEPATSVQPYEEMITAMKIAEWDLIKKRSESGTRSRFKHFAKETCDGMKEYVERAIDFMVSDALWEIVFDFHVQQEQESGEEGEECIDTETIEWERGVKKMKWLHDRENRGKFAKKEYQCRQVGSRWKSLMDSLKEEGAI